MTLYFVRHGETEWNVKKKIQGTTDIPLNEKKIWKVPVVDNFKSAGELTFVTFSLSREDSVKYKEKELKEKVQVTQNEILSKSHAIHPA